MYDEDSEAERDDVAVDVVVAAADEVVETERLAATACLDCQRGLLYWHWRHAGVRGRAEAAASKDKMHFRRVGLMVLDLRTVCREACWNVRRKSGRNVCASDRLAKSVNVDSCSSLVAGRKSAFDSTRK